MSANNNIDIQSIRKSQDIRDKLIDKMSKNKLPKADKNKKMLLSILKDKDYVSLELLRLKNNESYNDTRKISLQTLADFLKNINITKLENLDVSKSLPSLNSNYMIDDIVNGELDTGKKNLTQDDIDL